MPPSPLNTVSISSLHPKANYGIQSQGFLGRISSPVTCYKLIEAFAHAGSHLQVSSTSSTFETKYSVADGTGRMDNF